MNVTPKRNVLILLLISLSLGFSSCTGGKSAVGTTWALTKLVSVGDPVENSSTEIIEVKNCGIPIEKTTDCSAGTSNDLSVSLNSGGAFGVGSQFTIDGSVGTTLGIGQQSGQSVKLPNPSDGFIYTYTVSKNYQIVTGQAIARSSNGEEQTVNYNFHASCSIDIVNREETSCSSNNSAPNNQLPTTTTESTSTETPTWSFFLEYRFPSAFWSPGTHQYTFSTICTNESPDSMTREFLVSEKYPLITGDVYLKWSALRAKTYFGDIVEGINPSQSTVAATAWNQITKSEADWRAANCTGTILWDNGTPQPLTPLQPFQP